MSLFLQREFKETLVNIRHVIYILENYYKIIVKGVANEIAISRGRK